MTIWGKTIVTLGICIFTTSTLLWIIQGNWQWFAGGGAVFFGTLLTAAVISAETKPTPQSNRITPRTPIRSTQHDTQELPVTTQSDNDWQPPSTPPPDEVDPFNRPAQR